MSMPVEIVFPNAAQFNAENDILRHIAEKLNDKIPTELLADGAVTPKKLSLPTLKNGYAVVAAGDYSHAEGENHADQWFTEIGKEVVQIDGKYYLNVTPTTAGIYSYNIDGFLLYLNEAISGNISKAAGYYFYYREDFTDYIIATGVALTLDPAKLVAAKVTSDTPTPYNFDFDTDVIVFGAVAASNGSHCEGFSTSALNTYSHSEGYRAISTGHGAHAEGFHTQAKGRGTHTEGVYCRASGDYAHAEGSKTVASGDDAHAEGYKTRATGQYAHAEGEDTEAGHKASHAEGIGTKTSADHQHVSGMFNKDNPDALLMVGNGVDDGQRSNAFEVLKTGDIRANGVDVLRVIYNSYPAEVKSGRVVSFDDGAEGIPFKSLIMRRSANQNAQTKLTIRRLGKNLFDSNAAAYVLGYYITDTGAVAASSGYAYSKNYLPVLPDTDYVFSGDIVASSAYNMVVYYDENKNYLARYYDRDVSARGVPTQFKTPENCHFIRYVISKSRASNLKGHHAMLELGTVASAYEPYFATEYVATFSYPWQREVDLLTGEGKAEDGGRVTCTPIAPETLLGSNYFFMVEGTGEDEAVGDTITLDAVVRLDPTLAYNKSKEASAT